MCSHVEEAVVLPQNVNIIKLPVRHIPKPFRPYAFFRKVKNYITKSNFDFSLSLGRTIGQQYVLAPATHLGYMKYLGVKSKKLSDYMQVYLDRQSYLSSKKVFACSTMVKQELIDLYKIDKKKVEVLYPPFNASKFDKSLKNNKEQLKKKIGYSSEQILFLFVSTGHKRKGVPFLLKLFKELPETHQLMIIGKPEVKTNLPNVQYKGFESDLNEWYAIADFLIHPAKYEPYGQIVTEALYMDTPVVISDKVGAKELVGESEGLVLPEGELEVWEEKLLGIKLTDFNIDKYFVEKNELLLEHHMSKMMSNKKG